MRPRLTARRMVLATCLLLATAGLVAAGPTMAASAPVQKQGYITMTDGTKLAYAVELPSGWGRFPVARS